MSRVKKWLVALVIFSCVLGTMVSTASASRVAGDGGGAGEEPKTTYEIPTSGEAVNQNPDELDKNSKSLFGRYGLSPLILDYVEKLEGDGGKSCVSGWTAAISIISPALGLGSAAACAAGDSIGDAAKIFDMNTYITAFTTIIWWIYLYHSVLVIKLVSWAFSMNIVTYMLEAFKTTMNRMEATIWRPFMYIMWAVAVVWMVYFWISHKRTKLWSTIVNSILIIALSSTLLVNLPTYLQTVSDASTYTSVTVLAGLSDVQVPASLQNGAERPKNDIQISKAKAEQSAFLSINNISALAYLDAKADAEARKASERQKLVQRSMDTSLYGLFVDIPYLLINYGSIELANKRGWKEDPDKPLYEKVFEAGKHNKSREEVLQDAYKEMMAKKDTKGQNQMLWLTPAKAPQRFGMAILAGSLSFFALLCCVHFALLCIIWQFIAMGRALLGAVYLLISLWPGYGMKEAAQWFWSMIQALFMKVFYTIILAVYINMVIALLSSADQIGIIVIWLLAIGIYVGLLQALRELRQKLTNIPFGRGIMFKGAGNDAEIILDNAKDKVKKAGEVAIGAGLIVAGASTGNPALMKAGMATAQKGAGSAAKQFANQKMDEYGKKIGSERAEEEEKDKLNASEAEAKRQGDAAFEGRLNGLNPEDAQLARDVRDMSGIDLTMEQGMDMYEKIAPKDAEQNAEALERVREHIAEQRDKALAEYMATVMGNKAVPQEGTLEYAQLTQQISPEDLAMWKSARTEANIPVTAKVKEWNLKSAEEKLKEGKPTLSTAAVQKQFEAMLMEKREAMFRERAAEREGPPMTVDLNKLGPLDRGAGRVGNLNQPLVQINGLQKHMGNYDDATQQSIMDSVTKKVQEHISSLGIVPGKIDGLQDRLKTLTVEIPMKGGEAFGAKQQVEIKLGDIKAQSNNNQPLKLNMYEVEQQMKQTFANQARASMQPTQLQQIVNMRNFVAEQIGSKLELNIDTKLESVVNGLVSSLESKLANINVPGVNVSSIKSAREINDFMKMTQATSFPEQIEVLARAAGVPVSNSGDQVADMREDIEKLLREFRDVKRLQENMQKDMNKVIINPTVKTPKFDRGNS